MANYVTLRKGSGNTVENKRLQQALKDRGYGSYLGSAGVDGIFGSGTDAAVRKFQKDNGLTVDGIVGELTWGALLSGTSTGGGQDQQTTPQEEETEDERKYRYDPEQDPNYVEKRDRTDEVEGTRPVYDGTYDDQVEALFDEIMARGDFKYDLNGDPLWQQLSDQYTKKGQLAMMDTQAQAAALTGGYGSSHAQGVGQQTYQGYLQQLTDRVPELHQLALQKWSTDQALLEDQYRAAREMQDSEYGKYRDEYGDWQYERGVAREDEDEAYERGRHEWETEESLRREDENTEYGREQDARNWLVDMMANTGYVPTDEELAAAGMTREQADAILAQYKKSQKSSRSYSSSSGPKKGTTYLIPEAGGPEEAEFMTVLIDYGEDAAIEWAEARNIDPAIIDKWLLNPQGDKYLDPGA